MYKYLCKVSNFLKSENSGHDTRYYCLIVIILMMYMQLIKSQQKVTLW